MSGHTEEEKNRYSGQDELPKRLLWEKAQQSEFGFWQYVSINGYAEQTPDEFISSGQKDLMLGLLGFLEKPASYWANKVIVEFGSGPAGVVEYVQAKHKIAVEPLIEKYKTLFSHLEESEVEYINCPAEEAWGVPDEVADLIVCINVLDHTFDPNKVISQLNRVGKPGADLLFQVNVYMTEEEMNRKTGEHLDLHPFSFYPSTVIDLLRQHNFSLWKQLLSEEPNPYGEHFFMCAGNKT